MRPSFNVVEQYTGTGLLDTYSFEFLITALPQLLIVILDDEGEEVERVRGDDTTIIESVTFDTDEGGGEVVFIDPIGDDYTLLLFYANDEPTQDYEFRDKFSFDLEMFEKALDAVMGPVQRAIFLANRSLRINDGQAANLPGEVFDPQLPLELVPGYTLVIGEDGLSLALGPTEQQLADALQAVEDAEAAATAAAASAAAAATAETNAELAETNAEAAEVAAEAAQAAAEAAAAEAEAIVDSFDGFISTGPFTVPNNDNLDLTGEVTDSDDFTMVTYWMRVVRGTGVFAEIQFTIFFRDGAWELQMGEKRYNDDADSPGVAITVNSTTAQINVAADNGGSDAIVSLKKVRWAA